MDMEKQPSKSEASDDLPRWKSDIFRPQAPVRRRLRIFTGVALGAFLLWLKVSPQGGMLSTLGGPKIQSFPHHHRPLSLEEKERLFL